MKAKPPVPYVGNDVVAETLGVTTAAVSNWITRKVPGLPAPDAILRHRKRVEYGWLENRLDEWRAWYTAWKEMTAEYQIIQAEQALQQARERLAALKSKTPS